MKHSGALYNSRRMTWVCRLAMVALLVVCGCPSLSAQEGVEGQGARLTEVRFEPQDVLIGDHFELQMTVEAPEGVEVAFPAITPEFTEGKIELLEEYPTESSATTEGNYQLRKRYRLTSFEPAEYRLDSLGVLTFDGATIDTLFAEDALVLRVDIMPVDTAQKTIYDIRQPMKTPLVVEEFRGYVVAVLILGSVIAAVLHLLLSRTRKGRAKAAKEAELPKEAPHIVAIRALEQLSTQKLWQSGHYKAYYTRLTDILRDYLYGRFGVGAMEMTTPEIMAELRTLPLSERQVDELEELLVESDLVKFAKHTPAVETNEAAYYKVYYFVENTKEVEPKGEQGGVPEKFVEVQQAEVQQAEQSASGEEKA